MCQPLNTALWRVNRPGQEEEEYNFDTAGYLVLPGLLTSAELAAAAAPGADLEVATGLSRAIKCPAPSARA
jgi:hypothetical protein